MITVWEALAIATDGGGEKLVPTMTRTLTVLIDRQGIHQSAGRLSVGTKFCREDAATVTSFETESGRPVGPRGCSHGRR